MIFKQDPSDKLHNNENHQTIFIIIKKRKKKKREGKKENGFFPLKFNFLIFKLKILLHFLSFLFYTESRILNS